MLYYQVNGCPVNANNLAEVIKVLYSLFILSLYYILTL
jgi:hypothetical protein